MSKSLSSDPVFEKFLPLLGVPLVPAAEMHNSGIINQCFSSPTSQGYCQLSHALMYRES